MHGRKTWDLTVESMRKLLNYYLHNFLANDKNIVIFIKAESGTVKKKTGPENGLNCAFSLSRADLSFHTRDFRIQFASGELGI